MQELQLRQYQKEDVDFIVNKRNGRAYNGNEPGLGKTVETLESMIQLLSGKYRALIIGTKVSLGTWQYEALKWYGLKTTIYSGTPKQRAQIWEQFMQQDSGILITNFSMCDELQKKNLYWDFISADEIHKGGLLNHQTKTYTAFAKLKSKYMILMTGTPVRRGPQDLWAPFHLLYPKHFPAYWPFVYKHCIVIKTMFGKEIENRPLNAQAFNKMVFEYMVRRKKKDVLTELPDKIRQPLYLELEGAQKKAYEDLATNMMLELPNEEILITPNIATQILRLRQLLVTPQLLGIDEEGAGIEALRELVQDQFDIKKAVAICTPFRQAIPFIQKAMEDLTPHIFEIHGQIKQSAKEVSLEFQNCKAVNKIMLYTIKSGMSWDAYEASTVFFLGYEWGAYDNLQAEDRLHRIGQKDTVHVNYIMHKNTVDDLVLSKLNDKQMAENWIMRPQEVIKYLKSF